MRSPTKKPSLYQRLIIRTIHSSIKKDKAVRIFLVNDPANPPRVIPCR